MMVYVFIAAATVLSALIGFSILAIVRVSAIIGHTIQDKTLELISAYDQVLEEKSNHIRKIEEDGALQEGIEPQSEILLPTNKIIINPELALEIAEQAGKTQYRNSDGVTIYRQIKDTFSFDIMKILESIPGATKKRKEGLATKLLKDISYENFFQLSTLPEKEQYLILQESIPEYGQEILQEYYDGIQQFSSIGFRDYLMQFEKNEQGVILRVPTNTQYSNLPENISVIEDSSLCEGIKIEFEGVLYDYAISKREMS